MTNLDELGLRRAHSFALEHLVTVYSTSGDLRWAMVALIAQSVGAVWSYGRRRLARRVREAVRRLAPVGPFGSECQSC